jgi:polyferredoxin
MTRQAEAEALFNESRKIIHNQVLIRLLAVLAIMLPLPLSAWVFLGAFGLQSPYVIQGTAFLWLLVTIVYFTLALYVKAKQRNL